MTPISTRWQVVTMPGTKTTYGLARQSSDGIEWHADGAIKWRTYSLKEARAKRLELLDERRPVKTYSAVQFANMAKPTTMRRKTLDALRDIMVHGKTWSATAKRHDITESGILRAMRRMKALNQGASA